MKQKNKDTTISLIMAALFTALMAVFAQIQIPTFISVPITLQTFAIALCGYTMGVKYSLLSTLAYILLGVCGAPTFSGFCGGTHHLTDPQGGFVIAFPLFALFCALSFKFKKKLPKIGIGILGVVVMYIFGIAYFMFVTDVKSITAPLILFGGVFVKDILICIFAFYISEILKKRVLKSAT